MSITFIRGNKILKIKFFAAHLPHKNPTTYHAGGREFEPHRPTHYFEYELASSWKLFFSWGGVLPDICHPLGKESSISNR